MRFALKECAWRSVGDELVVVFDPRESIVIEDPDGRIAALLASLRACPRTVAELHASLAGDGIDVSTEEASQAIEGLAGLGLIDRADGLTTGDPVVDERHFSNLLFFGTFSGPELTRAELLDRVRNAHVLVLGVGGGGSGVVQCLAGLGVGELTLLDSDRVEPRNFARQFLYRHEDVGRSKVARAAAWVRAYDPDIKVHAVDRWVAGPEDLADLTDGVDVISGGLDGHPDVGSWINEVAVRTGVPFVGGGASRTQMTYYSVDPGVSSCLACERFERPDEASTVAAAEAAVRGDLRITNALIGPVSLYTGSLMALEVLRYATRFQEPVAAGRRHVIDLLDGMALTVTPFPEVPDCPVCRLAPAHRAAVDLTGRTT
ncbi:MAG TPA: ThiF family adenylyltransferase [Pseudonocardiaceae bacterium]|jgi:molybdopterin/thiamine biosynthesis adenylyltransferase